MKKLTNTIIISSLISILTLQVFGSFAQSNTNSSTATDLKFNYLNPQKVEVLNSEAEESMPIITSNGQELYFIRTQVASKKSLSKSGQEIWVATKNGDTWGSPQKEDLNINDLANNAVIGTSADGKTIYLFNSIETRHKLAKGLAYISKDSLGKWGEIKKLTIPGFEVGDGYYAFYVTSDENTILVSAALDTMAYEDIYVSEKIDGNWTPLKNLGSNVNTSSIETSPFISEDKKTLYFSSAGHGGFGETDLFKSIRTGIGWDEWSKPINLGNKINSPGFDAYLVVSSDEKRAYFSSNRKGKYSDIFYVADFGKIKLDKGKLVRLSFDNVVLSNETIEIYNDRNELIKVITTDEDGAFEFEKIEGAYFRIKEMNLTTEDLLVFIEEEVAQNDTVSPVYNLASLQNSTDPSPSKGKLVRLSFDNVVLSNETIEIYNDRNELIKVITTDEDGAFEFEKIEGAYFRIKEMNLTTEDLLVFIEEEVAQNDTVSPVYNLASLQNSTDLPIQFVFNGVVMANETVELLSPDGQVIGSAMTDENGRINQSSLGTANSYRIGANTITESKLSELVAQSKANSSDGEAVVNFNSSDEPIQFVFNGVVMANETVELLSPDGQVIGSATTDENGRINQSNLGTANSYRIGANTITDSKLSELVAQSKANSSDGAAVVNFTDEQVKEYIVYFDFDKSIIKTSEMEKLDDLIAYIKDNGKIELSGHTDYKGPQSYNLILSDKRVKAVNDYLIDKGLDKSRIISKEAKGELIPIAENSTLAGRAKNRRVEIKVTN